MRTMLGLLLTALFIAPGATAQLTLDGKNLKQLINDHKAQDTTLVNLIITYNQNMLLRVPGEELLPETHKALKLSEKLNYIKGNVFSNQLLADIYSLVMNNPYKALEYYQKALNYETDLYAIKDKALRKRVKYNAYAGIGTVYYNIGDYENALKYFNKANDEAKKNKIADNSNVYMNIGNTYNSKENPDEAIYYYKEAIRTADTLNMYAYIGKTTVANSYICMAVALRKQGKLQEALQAVNRGAMMASRNKLALIWGNANGNGALIHLDLGNLEKAEKMAKASLQINSKNGNAFMLRDTYQCLYNVYKKQNRDEEALEALEKYSSLNDSLTNNDKKLKIFRNQLQYEAERKELLANSEIERQKILKREELNRKEILYEADKKTSAAKAENEKQKIIRQEQLNRKEMHFEADKKQALATAEIDRQKIIRNSIIGGSSLAGIFAVVLFTGYRKRQKTISLQKELLLKAQISDTEMKVLRLQLNPHFIFNSLNSIGDYISKNDIQTADYYLSKFAKLMRGILENSEEKEISLSDELKMLELYMQLEASRLNNKFTYEIKVQDGINTESTLVPPLILQPFVENSIWHGLAKKEGRGKITIEVTKDNEMLSCIVEDDGVGRNKNAKGSGKSYGMKITKDRIDLLNRLKNAHASVHLVDLERGTRAEVKLPFDEEL